MFKKYKKWFIIGGIVLVIAILVLISSRNKNKVEYTTVTLNPSSFTQTVSEVGVLKSAQELSLSFSNPGQVAEVLVAIGDSVEEGQELMKLEADSLNLKKIEALAGLSIAQANYSKLLAGASSETLAISYQELDQAQSARLAAQADLEQVRKTSAENIKQAQDSLRDLTEPLAGTSTASEQGIIMARLALESTDESSAQVLASSLETLLLTLSDKVLLGEVALDNLKTILDDPEADSVLGVKNIGSRDRVTFSRRQIINSLPALKQTIDRAKSSQLDSDVKSAVTASKSYLSQLSSIFNEAFAMLEATVTSVKYPQSYLDAHKNIVIAESNKISGAANALEGASQGYNSALSNRSSALASAKQSLKQAEVAHSNAILVARNTLSNVLLNSDQQLLAAQSRLDNANKAEALVLAKLRSVTAPARNQDIALAQAQLEQAQAALASIENQLDKTIIKAPISALVSEVNFKPGEQALGGQVPALKLLVADNFEIEVDIAESDINKISLGDKADISLDALADDFIISGQVSFIEPAQTLISGVVYYKIKISLFDIREIEARLSLSGLSLKAGMTANVDITTLSKDNVLAVPARAIIDSNGNKKVRVLVNKKLDEREVKTGQRGDDGLIEILFGLEAGDEIITFIKN